LYLKYIVTGPITLPDTRMNGGCAIHFPQSLVL
jgi:hypothetical protein